MENIVIYANGLCFCSVCADTDLSLGDVLEYVNAHNPAGIDSHWKIAKENFRDGSNNPCQCNTDKNRTHYLLSC